MWTDYNYTYVYQFQTYLYSLTIVRSFSPGVTLATSRLDNIHHKYGGVILNFELGYRYCWVDNVHHQSVGKKGKMKEWISHLIPGYENKHLQSFTWYMSGWWHIRTHKSARLNTALYPAIIHNNHSAMHTLTKCHPLTLPALRLREEMDVIIPSLLADWRNVWWCLHINEETVLMLCWEKKLHTNALTPNIKAGCWWCTRPHEWTFTEHYTLGQQ